MAPIVNERPPSPAAVSDSSYDPTPLLEREVDDIEDLLKEIYRISAMVPSCEQFPRTPPNTPPPTPHEEVDVFEALEQAPYFSGSDAVSLSILARGPPPTPVLSEYLGDLICSKEPQAPSQTESCPLESLPTSSRRWLRSHFSI